MKNKERKMADRNGPVAVIDSGVGGVSVLRELISLMPNENFIFFGDSANAPYGEKSAEQVRKLTFDIAERLFARFGFKGDTVDGLCKALAQNNSGKRFYSRSNVAYIDRGDIVITRISEEDACEITVREGQQRAYCGNSVLYFELCDVDSLTTYNVPDNVALFDADKIVYPLTLRRWKEGDSFTPFGMTGSKKVSDFLIDAKVSMAEKGRQFVLLSEQEIAWLVGRRIDDKFRITNKTERVIRITKEII